VMMGKPVIKGTRIAVSFLLELFGQGWDSERVLANYPQLTPEDLQAVFAFSAARIKDEESISLKDGTSG
jgi:uncharacterized protein (DUF433 family)